MFAAGKTSVAESMGLLAGGWHSHRRGGWNGVVVLDRKPAKNASSAGFR